MLEGLILKKPVIQFILDDDLIKINQLESPIHQVNDIQTFENIFSRFMDDIEYKRQIISKIPDKLNDYLSYQKTSSKKFLTLIEENS